MLFRSWIENLKSAYGLGSGRGTRSRQALRLRRSFMPRLDLLEDRTLLTAVSFSAPVNYAVGGNPLSVAVGDFNGDGRPDLAVANAGSNTVNVLLGNGDGTFQTARSFSDNGLATYSVVVGDFNGDGKLDLAVASPFGYQAGTVGVLLGNGDGTFQTPKDIGVRYAHSLGVGDFNGDGKLDLIAVNEINGTVSVLLGNGDGTFQTAQNFTAGGGSDSVAVGDFNGDGKPDLAVANFGSNNVSVLLGNGDGTFQTVQNFSVGSAPSILVVGDFNGDGKLDLATAGVNSNNVSVLLGNGDGTFRTAQNFTAGSLPSARSGLAVGDFNGDGKLDLAVASSFNFQVGNVGVLLGNGDGTFQTAQSFPVVPGLSSLAVGDFNGDGRPDLVTANANVSVLLNQFGTTTVVSGPTSSTYGQAVNYTATVTSGAAPVIAGTVTFLDNNTPISPALPLSPSGQATFSIATLNAGSHTITASYSGTPSGAGITPIGPSAGNAGLMVNPLPLSATAVNFSAIAGAPFSGAVATFTNPDPFGSAATYTAIITWGDGSTSTGTITGTGALKVSGSHTYADPGIDAVSVQISHNLGNTTTATVYPTANVTSLGQDVQHGLTGGIGFWHGKNGQALINGFNGGSNSIALSSWLATNFSNLYGAGAGGNNLTGETNAQVAAFYQSQFALSGSKLEADVLATALNLYATTQSLGGTIGQKYGFTISADGLGADSFNVGVDGAAFDVANNTTLNVYELLKAVDRQAVFGVLYNGDKTLRNEANDLFDALNKAGAI